MKKNKIVLVIGSLISFTTMAGHLSIDNHTNTSFQAQCGHHGDLGSSHQIEPGHSASMEVHGDHSGRANCQAVDHHGNVLATRNFDFHHGNESYSWEVSHQNNH